MKILGSTVALCFLLAATALVGCSHRSDAAAPNNLTLRTTRLSVDTAAELAAQLANDECDRRYHKRPFRPDQHAAVLDKGQYRWGGLDVGGRGGFSALVTFGPDGAHPKVEVYFSSDILSAP